MRVSYASAFLTRASRASTDNRRGPEPLRRRPNPPKGKHFNTLAILLSCRCLAADRSGVLYVKSSPLLRGGVCREIGRRPRFFGCGGGRVQAFEGVFALCQLCSNLVRRLRGHPVCRVFACPTRGSFQDQARAEFRWLFSFFDRQVQVGSLRSIQCTEPNPPNRLARICCIVGGDPGFCQPHFFHRFVWRRQRLWS